MVEVLSEVEGEPASRPDMSPVLSADTLDYEIAAWHRLEAWTAHRWGERSVTWTVRGPGTWEPRLRPFTLDTAEVWRDGGWQTTTLEAGPIGYELGAETYRIAGTAGATGDVPQGVLEAFRRLVQYMAQVANDAAPGYTSATDGDFSFDRPAGWAARAIHYSGAADLLRAYR